MEVRHNRNEEERMIHISMSEEDGTEPASAQSCTLQSPYTSSDFTQITENLTLMFAFLKSNPGPRKYPNAKYMHNHR